MGEPARSAAKTWVGDGKWVRARSAGESWVRQGDEQMELVEKHSPDPFSYSKFHYLTLPNRQNFRLRRSDFLLRKRYLILRLNLNLY